MSFAGSLAYRIKGVGLYNSSHMGISVAKCIFIEANLSDMKGRPYLG